MCKELSSECYNVSNAVVVRALFNTYTGNINNGYDNDLTYDDNYWLSE